MLVLIIAVYIIIALISSGAIVVFSEKRSGYVGGEDYIVGAVFGACWGVYIPMIIVFGVFYLTQKLALKIADKFE